MGVQAVGLNAEALLGLDHRELKLGGIDRKAGKGQALRQR